MTRRRRLFGFSVWLIGTLVVWAPPGEAQTWKDVLTNAAQNAVEERTTGDAGRIRRVRITRRAPSEITVEAQLSGVKDPDSLHIEAELLDNKGHPIEPLVVKPGAIPQGDGTVQATVRFTGRGTVHSSILLLKLVTADGAVASQRSTMVVKGWQGTGEQSPPTPTPTPSPTPTPRILRLKPVPVGDTPRGASASAGGGLVLAPGLGRPAVTLPRPIPPPPRSVGKQPGFTPLGAVPLSATLVDLYRAAFNGRWTNGSEQLPFNGPANDRRGFVRALGRHRLSDGKLHERVLETHPRWSSNGVIVGDIPVTLPAQARHITAEVGFLPGAKSTDGVIAQIFVLRQGAGAVRLWSRRVLPGDGAVPVSVALPPGYAGTRITVRIRVLAGASSAQDWFAWSALRVTD